MGGLGRDLVTGGNGNDRISVLDGVVANDAADGGAGFDLCVADLFDAVVDCP